MILRRFMQHVQEQNWFAVGLDVTVVIVGIFLGLQVQAAYEEQQDKVAEVGYLNRLHDEITDVIDIGNANFEQREFILRRLEEVVDVMVGKNTDLQLSNIHCNSINQSHIYFNQIASISTITEILNSGRAEVISNQNIITLISQYILIVERWEALIDSIRYGSMQISNHRPDLIKINQNADIRSSNTNASDFTCDFEQMKADDLFPNYIYNNARRYRAFVNQITAQLDVLRELHNELDVTLAISHD